MFRSVVFVVEKNIPIQTRCQTNKYSKLNMTFQTLLFFSCFKIFLYELMIKSCLLLINHYRLNLLHTVKHQTDQTLISGLHLHQKLVYCQFFKQARQLQTQSLSKFIHSLQMHCIHATLSNKQTVIL